jgi:protein-disulfide isomerase
MKRRQILITGVTAAGLSLGGAVLLRVPEARAEDAPVTESDRVLGAADAPVTIIEYASLTCPHCATFHSNTLPDIKKDWIEPGKARLVYRDFPLDGLALRAAALAQCVEGERYFSFLETLFRGQAQWSRAPDPFKALAQISRLAGIDQETFDACISDNERLDAILQTQIKGKDAFGIQSTPSFIVNGRKVEGAKTTEQFEKILQEAESKS